jgi:hypothetical protein
VANICTRGRIIKLSNKRVWDIANLNLCGRVLMSSNNSDNIFTLEMEINNVLEDLYGRIRAVLEKYVETPIRSVPSLEDLDNKEKYFEYYDYCLSVLDEYSNLRVRMDVVIHNLRVIKSTRMSSHVSNDFKILRNLSDKIGAELDQLKEYKFALIDMTRNGSDRIRLLQSISFK